MTDQVLSVDNIPCEYICIPIKLYGGITFGFDRVDNL
jgi:hypothetical protein